MSQGLLSEMRALPPGPSGAAAKTASLDVSLLIPARSSAHALEHTVEAARAFLGRRYPGAYEIVLIPNVEAARPGHGAPADRSAEVARALEARHAGEVRVAAHEGPLGKGAALRTGYLASRGRRIFMTDADLPYDLEFFDRAETRLADGADLVTGNRRAASSEFEVPVSLLPLAYKRHRLGLAFNRAVRLLLPIRTRDTQSGLKAMSRRLAETAFTRLACPGFFFDLELFLSAAGQGWRHVELPVVLELRSEKSTVRVLRQSVLAAWWLARITIRQRLGVYGRAPDTAPVGGPVRRYRSISLGTRFFLHVRWWLTPYARMIARLPERGQVLDLGCGHGLLALAVALDAAASGDPGARQVLGVDHDDHRIGAARIAAQGVPGLRFERGSVLDIPRAPTGAWDAIALIDVMHYFGFETQSEIARALFARLVPGGTCLFREVNPSEKGLRSSINQAYEKIATTIGFTRSDAKSDLFFRSPPGWAGLFREAGFEVGYERCSSLIFADVLFTCRKPAGAAS